MTKEKTYFFDMFSGIGGFALAAYNTGLRFDGHYFSEVDKYAVELYKKRFPDAIPLGDITEVDYEILPKGKWLVTGGFPCQPHSLIRSKNRGGGQKTSEIYGLCVSKLYAIYNQKLGCLKMLQDYLVAMEENSLIRCCLIFSDAGMMRNGKLYLLKKSARSIKGKEYGLLPTPLAREYMGLKFKREEIKKVIRKNIENGNNFTRFLTEIIKLQTGKNLKVDFVEMMMGYPEKWTDLEAAVTPLFLNVQKK